ncbi:DUF494 domain-containing protein [candidate division KSB1 bacterium]|nr:DUF494 domain-containing protein [candidate division KSB1 bacterium]
MSERVVEILVYIMQEIKTTHQGVGKLDLLSEELTQKGYTANEISSAFSWLFDKMKDSFDELVKNTGPTSRYSFRVLHEVEKMIISPDAYGYLIQLRELGLLDATESEQMIEKALMLGTSQVSLDEMKTIVASSLFNPADPFDSSSRIFNHFYQIH